MVEDSGIGRETGSEERTPAYYSRAIASLPPPVAAGRRPRRGSLERPVNGRMYRGSWLLVVLPLLICALSVARPTPLPPPALPPAFDGDAALALALDLSKNWPDRTPGSPGATGAERWLATQLAPSGFSPLRERYEVRVPGLGRVPLVNLLTVVKGRSDQAIVVVAHRDDTAAGEGANDNASGTAALIELARAYASPRGGAEPQLKPSHTLVFLSTDGATLGALGASQFLHHSRYGKRVLAAVVLDGIASPSPARLEIGGDRSHSPSRTFVETAAARVEEQTGVFPGHTSALGQLVDLAFPYTLYEQGPFVGRRIPAVTLTTLGDRPPAGGGDIRGRLDGVRLTQLGRAAQLLLGSLDQGGGLARGSSSYIFLGSRLVRGWALQLTLVAALLPFLAAAVDLFARCRRRGIRLGGAVRAYRRRLGFWLFLGALFELFALLGAWPKGAARPISPDTPAATHWPALALAAFGVLAVPAWFLARELLRPRRPVTAGEELAGHATALLALGLLGLLAVSTNVYALVFLLPSLHAWLWLPQLRGRSGAARLAVFLAGLFGPLLLVASFAIRFGLGADAFWYVGALAAVGYVPLPTIVLVLAWAAAGAQLAALAAGRYAPYPLGAERRPRGPMREVVRRVILTIVGLRAQRRAVVAERRAL